MGGYSGSRPYLRFASVSLLVAVMVLVTATWVGTQLAGRWHEDAAAHESDRLVAEPLMSLLPGAGQDIDDATLAAAVEPLIAGGITYVRVSSPDGTTLFETDGAPSRRFVGGGSLSWNRVDIDGDETFVTSSAGDGFVVEVGKSVGPLNASIRHTQLEKALVTALFVVGAWILMQFAFWYGIRTHVESHFRLKYLYDTGEQLRSSLDLHDVLTRLAGDATGLTHGRFGLVALLDEDTNDLLLKTTFDSATGNITLHQRALDEWFIRRCVATNQTVVSTQSANAYTQIIGQTSDVDASSPLLCVPLALRDRVVGAIGVIRAAGSHTFTPEETRLVEDLASQAVAAIEQAQLFARVRADASELENSYDTTLKVLMAALDAKDNDTEGHCERVAKLTVQLAKFMDVPAASLVDIERGALLHDVGKIGVPDAVLNQPTKLNELEWEAMRKHPLLAGVMVSKVGFLEKAMPILLYHHERYDGGGYPFGLSGDNIPLEARIFSIVDAYDAMTSDRPYRAAMSHAEAMAEVRANCGSQFDPTAVDAFEQLMALRPDLRDNSGHRMRDDHDTDLDPSRDESAA
jgi:HD-GYP domain-containing protein (c-di-GMP phosphodiesterase class II)